MGSRSDPIKLSPATSARVRSAWLMRMQDGAAEASLRASSGRSSGDHAEVLDQVGVEGAVEVDVGPGDGLGDPPGGQVVGVGLVASEPVEGRPRDSRPP